MAFNPYGLLGMDDPKAPKDQYANGPLPYQGSIESGMGGMDSLIGRYESASMPEQQERVARVSARRAGVDRGLYDSPIGAKLEQESVNNAQFMFDQDRNNKLASLYPQRQELALALQDREEKRRMLARAALAARRKKQSEYRNMLFTIAGGGIGLAGGNPMLGASIGGAVGGGLENAGLFGSDDPDNFYRGY